MSIDLSPTRLIRRVRGDSLARNSVGIMGTSVVNALLGYVYWTLAARLMPASAVGLGSALTSAMIILSLGVHLGVGGGLTARLPRRKNRQDWLLTVFSAIAACSAVTLVLATAALFPLAYLLKPLHALATDPVLAFWFVLGAVCWTASGLIDYVFIAQRSTNFMFSRNGVASAVKLAALVAVTTFGHADATDILATWSFSALIGTIHGLIICHRNFYRLGAFRWRESGAELNLMARPSLGHHAISVGGLIPTYLLPVVVTARLGTQDNAYFYVTWMIGSAIFMISPAVSSAIFAEGSHEPEKLRRIAVRSLWICLAMVTPATFLVAAAGFPILEIFGHSYAHAGYALLLVLLLSSYPEAVTNVSVATMRVQNKLRSAAALNLGMALIAVGGAWIFTTHLGIIGAGVAWLVAQTSRAAVVGIWYRQLWPPKDAAPTPVPATAHDAEPADAAVLQADAPFESDAVAAFADGAL